MLDRAKVTRQTLDWHFDDHNPGPELAALLEFEATVRFTRPGIAVELEAPAPEDVTAM